MTPEQLKNSILQLAIEGKLVEQRKEEGTGEELFKEIQEEKQKLIEEGTLKQPKNLPEITDEAIPFDIPETWKWVRLGDSLDVRDGTHDTPKYVQKGYPLVTSKNLKNGIIDFENCKYISEIDYLKISERSKVNRHDILFAMIGSIGNPVLVSTDMEFSIKNTALFKNISSIIEMRYLYWFLFISQDTMKKRASGGVQSFVSLKFLRTFLLPLPPLAEQKRIVGKIEELLPLVDRYEKAWTRLEELNKKFPLDMQKSILQEAIQGKLVEQRKEEGTGEELFKEIQKYEDFLIRNKSIKKEKPFPSIEDNEYLFDIPDNWIWVRFGELGRYKKGPFGSALTKNIFVPKGDNTIKVYEQKNAIKKDASIGEYYITESYFANKLSGFSVEPGDIIVSCAGTIGEAFILPSNIEKGIINQALMRMRLFEPIFVEYFLLYFDYVLKKNARENSKGSAIKNIPPFVILKNYLVPLPPLAEQKRIVEKIEELLYLCEKLK